MSLNLEGKKEVVAEVSAQLADAQAVVIAEYRGLPVEQITVLRSQARANGVYLRVLENVKKISQIIFVSAVAFPIWAINIAIARIDLLQDREFLASSLLVMVTLFIPLVIRNARP